MKPIRLENNLIIYYGNPAGWLDDEHHALVDTMFETPEMKNFLSRQTNIQEIHWSQGIFDRLRTAPQDKQHDLQILKKCRIWQLKPDVDMKLKFISYDELMQHSGFLDPNNYHLVFDGEVETNDLEKLYNKFNYDQPLSYRGHSLSISDIVELYDEHGSTFHYVDRIGYQQITFDRNEPSETLLPNQMEQY